MGFGVWVPDSGSRVPGFVVSDFGFGVSGFGCTLSEWGGTLPI